MSALCWKHCQITTWSHKRTLHAVNFKIVLLVSNLSLPQLFNIAACDQDYFQLWFVGETFFLPLRALASDCDSKMMS